MKWAVTGGAGFIGSHLVDALVSRGDQLLVLDDLSTGRRENLAGAFEAGSVRLEVGDITDPAFMPALLSSFEPDAVFHLAAQADIRSSVADPSFDATVNVLGTINVLHAARGAGSPVVFAATGGAVYGEGEGRALPFGEDDPAAPITPYGASKLAGESYVWVYRTLHGVPGLSLRFGNIYGPRQDPHGEAGVVAIFCGKLLAGEPLTVYGDGRQTRDYLFVGDAVAALLAAADALVGSDGPPAGPFNIGTGAETSVIELLERLGDAVGLEPRWSLVAARHGEVERVSIDPAAARRELGWEPSTDLESGLQAAFESVKQDREAQERPAD